MSSRTWVTPLFDPLDSEIGRLLADRLLKKRAR